MRNQPRTTREDLVNDLEAAGTIVTKKTIGNTIRREGLKSCSAPKVPLLKKAHVQARLKFANDSEVNWVQVLWSVRSKSSSLASTQLKCLEEECCLWPQEHHPHRQTWRWKHYALGVFFCQGDRTTALHQRNDGQGHVPSGPAKRSGTKSLLRCVQTCWPTTRNIWPLWLPTRVLPPSTKSCFAKGSKTYFTH